MKAQADPKRFRICPPAPGDAEAFAAFRCSTGPKYEQVVERHVREEALTRAFARNARLSVLAMFEGDRLVGCAGHQSVAVSRASGPDPHGIIGFATAKITFVAIALEDQGRRFTTGPGLAEALMIAAIRDARAAHGSRIVVARVARENHRSRRLCERVGLNTQAAAGPAYIVMSRAYGPPEQA